MYGLQKIIDVVAKTKSAIKLHERRKPTRKPALVAEAMTLLYLRHLLPDYRASLTILQISKACRTPTLYACDRGETVT